MGMDALHKTIRTAYAVGLILAAPLLGLLCGIGWALIFWPAITIEAAHSICDRRRPAAPTLRLINTELEGGSHGV